MKLNLKTKFDIGDIVYAADHYYDFYATSKPYIISNILIYANGQDVRIMYWAEQDGIADRFPEDWLFATYDECKQWCEKQNKEE